MHIALVETSRIGRKIVTTMLDAQGYMVSAFDNGEEAFCAIRADTTIDVVITSFETEGIGGLELCWDVRLLSRDRPIYIIAMSSTADTRKLVEALDSGADDFLYKPLDDDTLQARLRQAGRFLDLQRELVRLAFTDTLTGAMNRRAFFDKSKTALSLCKSDTKPLSIIMADIDHFKRINDNFGHDIGDLAICAFADICKPTSDYFARLGGEEFAILLPDTSIDTAFEIAEDIRMKTLEIQIKSDKGSVEFSASLGVAAATPNDAIQPLLKRSDTALYIAKNSGRNKTTIFEYVEDEALDDTKSPTAMSA